MLNNIFTCRETPKNLLATVQKIEVSMTMNSDSDYIMELNDIKKANANRTTKKIRRKNIDSYWVIKKSWVIQFAWNYHILLHSQLKSLPINTAFLLLSWMHFFRLIRSFCFIRFFLFSLDLGLLVLVELNLVCQMNVRQQCDGAAITKCSYCSLTYVRKSNAICIQNKASLTEPTPYNIFNATVSFDLELLRIGRCFSFGHNFSINFHAQHLISCTILLRCWLFWYFNN